MAIVVWIIFGALGALLLWEAAVRLRRWRNGVSGRETDPDRYYAPEAETRRELDAAASRAAHSAESGITHRARKLTHSCLLQHSFLRGLTPLLRLVITQPD